MPDISDVITCIVQRGKADKVVKSAMAAGAQGATIFYARGTGVRQKLGILGGLISPEKEVIIIVTKESQTQAVYKAAIDAAELQKPGKGFAYIHKAEQAVGFMD